jgi:hypothetical protein
METQPTTTKKIATTYGLYLGAILALITTLMYSLNQELFTKWWIGILTILIVITLGIVSVAKSKGAQNGIITFKDAFTSYFITVAVGLAISTVVGILIFNVIDPELASYLQEKTIELTREFMEKFNTPEADIEEALAKMAETDNFSIISQLKSYVFGLLFQAVLGLLVALIFKRKDPNAIS